MEDSRAIGRAATKGSKLKIIDAVAAIIRRIFEEFANGRSCIGIWKELNLENTALPRSRSKKWGPDAIKRILRNEKYLEHRQQPSVQPL